jgi:hypothetical protein
MSFSLTFGRALIIGPAGKKTSYIYGTPSTLVGELQSII